jgi:hypothetical protein
MTFFIHYENLMKMYIFIRHSDCFKLSTVDEKFNSGGPHITFEYPVNDCPIRKITMDIENFCYYGLLETT